MNTEPPYAGLKWAHYLRVMLLVPLDQGTQGNKGRKDTSLVYNEISLYSTTKLLASSTNYSLPTLLQSQTRHKPPVKALSQCEKKVSVDMMTPFRIMSYKNEVKGDADAKSTSKAAPCGKRGKAVKNQATAAATSTR